MNAQSTENSAPVPQRVKPLAPQKKRTIHARGYSKKEWEPMPGLDKLTSPIHQTISTLAHANKWLQLWQITCILLAGLQDTPAFLILFFALIYLPQLVYCFTRKKDIDQAEKHYRGYYTTITLPQSINCRLPAAKPCQFSSPALRGYISARGGGACGRCKRAGN